jgi:hypothetical protein
METHVHLVAAPTDSPLGQEYRPPRYYFWIGASCTAFFVVMMGASIWALLTNVDDSFAGPVMATICGTILGLFALLGLWILWAYHVERLLLWEDRVRYIGTFRTREVQLAEVERAKWRLMGDPGGSLVLYAGDVRLVMYFANYGDHGPRIRDFFRSAIHLDRQERWEAFSDTHMPPSSEKKEKMRRQAKWVFAVYAVIGAMFLGIGIADPFHDVGKRWLNLILGGLMLVYCPYRYIQLSRPLPPTDAGESVAGTSKPPDVPTSSGGGSSGTMPQ